MADPGADDEGRDRAAEWAAWGVRGTIPPGREPELRVAVATDPSPAARAVALVALVRAASADHGREAWRTAATDSDPTVRRRASEIAPRVVGLTAGDLVGLLGDADGLVAEAAAWALGELGDRGPVPTLSTIATGHDDPLVREAAVAALGVLGDDRGLPAILDACRDKPTIRRRAVLALAPFAGPEVDAALAAALEDRDWQVRQAAEDLASD